jgi:ethanolamine ammonia-lyase large subunit
MPYTHTLGGHVWRFANLATLMARATQRTRRRWPVCTAVSKPMRNQDLILVARKCRVITRFRNTLGLPGRMAMRLVDGVMERFEIPTQSCVLTHVTNQIQAIERGAPVELEDHFCGKLQGLPGLPIGCDVCYTNHAEADSDDMDTLMTLLGTAGVELKDRSDLLGGAWRAKSTPPDVRVDCR